MQNPSSVIAFLWSAPLPAPVRSHAPKPAAKPLPRKVH